MEASSNIFNNSICGFTLYLPSQKVFMSMPVALQGLWSGIRSELYNTEKNPQKILNENQYIFLLNIFTFQICQVIEKYILLFQHKKERNYTSQSGNFCSSRYFCII